jgi:lysylphosphatidylglycerol synthetase-like protein (DUF2156 family)
MIQNMKGKKKEMKKTIRTALAGLLLVPVLALGVSTVTGVSEASAQIGKGLNATNTGQGPRNLTGSNGVFLTVVNVLLFIIGAISVIMLIYGGIRYTVSGGDTAAVTAAKNTILYAIVGLIIAFFAYAIVNFVIGSLTGGFTGGTNV